MYRTCDGNDPNLTRRVWSRKEKQYIFVTCSCGKTFDDVYHLTTYPHERF